jgi:hypothetical protein
VTGPLPRSSSAALDQCGTDSISASVNTRTLRTSRVDWSALIDHGANGSIAGRDMRVIARTDRSIDLSGIDDHIVRNLTLVTAGVVVATPQGDIVLIVHQIADMTSDSHTILSAGQLEAFGCKVFEKSPHITQSTPYLVTPGGYRIPMSIRKGLPYIRMRPFGEKDWNDLPHVAITSPAEWNPAVLDADVSPRWYQEQPSNLMPFHNSLLTPSGHSGELKDNPEASDDDSFLDRRHQAVDRGRITAYLTHLIRGELEDGYVLNVTTRQRSSRSGESIATGVPDTAKACQRPR